MKKALFTALLVSILMGAMVISSTAASGYEAHHPDGEQPSTSAPAMQGMMGMSGMMHKGKGMMAEGMPCMTGPGRHMMGMDSGMMAHRMAHMFFLHQADALELTSEQRTRLRALHATCRKDTIRNAAEAKIARLELADLLDSDNWSLKDAETLVRKVQRLEGDIQVRHLQALTDARKVLTPAQLEKLRSRDKADTPESLFQ